jgi:hypothetical protein
MWLEWIWHVEYGETVTILSIRYALVLKADYTHPYNLLFFLTYLLQKCMYMPKVRNENKCEIKIVLFFFIALNSIGHACEWSVGTQITTWFNWRMEFLPWWYLLWL